MDEREMKIVATCIVALAFVITGYLSLSLGSVAGIVMAFTCFICAFFVMMFANL